MQSPSVIISHSKCCCILECSLDATVRLTDSGFGFRYTICICEGEGRAMGTSCCLELSWEQMYKLSTGKEGFYSLITLCVFHMDTDLHRFYFLEAPNNLWDLGFENIWGCLSPVSVFSYVCVIWEMLMTSLHGNLPLQVLMAYAFSKCRYGCE